jgi:outer membrane receptor protein involved in Fe transport
MKYCFVLVLILAATGSALCQDTRQISGSVTDEQGTAVPFANVAVYNQADSTLAAGAVSDDLGKFQLAVKPAAYYLKVSFLSFNEKVVANVDVRQRDADVGRIVLSGEAKMLDEVTVRGEKSTMELSLDKKIFNVGKDLANAGGSASDILTNIPSVSVDPEGNVKLRGSDNVRILIDGKPSGLVSFKGGSGLQQLQASMIERVEVITNPSARYEAEGMAGIINIVLKKERNQGFNGSFEAISGYPLNLGGAANLNYRHRKVNFFINYSIAYRKQPGTGKQYQERERDDTTFITRQTNDATITGFNNNIRGGIDLYFTETSILTGSYLFRRSDATRITDIRYEDYLFNESNLDSVTTRRQDEDEIEPNSEYSLIYKKSFKGKDHALTAEVKYLDNWESSNQTFTQHTFVPAGIEDLTKARLQKSLNDESEKQLLLQLDYSKPFGKDGHFETGLRSSSREMINDFVVSQRNQSGEFVPLPGLDNIFLYNENINALYGIVGNKYKKISYQVGLRAEWTDVKTTLQETNQVNPRKYANLFPSAHFTVSLPKSNDVQISYSRRVRRPFYNDLSPFMTFSDSRNYFSGNPDLNPEFSNVYEISHIKYFEKGSLSSSVYYRDAKGKIERIRTVGADGNATTLPQNLNSERSGGLEFTSEYALEKWWKLDFNFNFFYADIDGTNIMETYKATTYSWFARQSSRFTLPANFDLQLRGNYEAPQKTAQGRRRSLYYIDISMSKDVFKGRGTLNFNVLDVFNTRRQRSITTGPGFYTEGNFQFRRRQLNLTLSYRINQAKPAKKTESEE